MLECLIYIVNVGQSVIYLGIRQVHFSRGSQLFLQSTLIWFVRKFPYLQSSWSKKSNLVDRKIIYKGRKATRVLWVIFFRQTSDNTKQSDRNSEQWEKINPSLFEIILNEREVICVWLSPEMVLLSIKFLFYDIDAYIIKTNVKF